ncbi:MAG: AAA domain-containing protein [Victivallaceae bacterium]|nr:AAA domain-containing protein [Victivallaceae bacterium]
MNNELDKINFFYEEGRRLWRNNPDYVLTREFYELWESVHQPQPFTVGGAIKLLGIDFELPSGKGDKIAYYTWLAADCCPALLVETGEWEKRFLLTFSEGETQIYEEELVRFSDDDYGLGEKLEIAMEVIAHLRQGGSTKNVLSLSKKDFIGVMERIAGRYPPGLRKALNRASAGFIRSLIHKAAADMAADELSPQLSLPLEGDYSWRAESGQKIPETSVVPAHIPTRTAWQIRADLEFINHAYRLATEKEAHFVLPLKAAEIIGLPGNSNVPLKIAIAAEMPIQQNDILNVFVRGESDVFGTFKVDVFDGDEVLGRLRCDYPGEVGKLRDRLFAALQRSPREFLTGTFEQLYRSFCGREDNEHSGSVLKYLLGFEHFTFKPGKKGVPPAGMDASQQSAWRSAIAPDNPVVLIQGPPGTGKTFCLEQAVRELCAQGRRILITAPSNTAVDNICRRINDLPVLRFGKTARNIAPDVAAHCWVGMEKNVKQFVLKRERLHTGGIYAGTQVGLLCDPIVSDDMQQNGCYDVVIFDEAGMSNLEEFVLCARLGKRVVLFGDHLQLPPFPLPAAVIAEAAAKYGPLPRERAALIRASALEWLAKIRKIPVIMLRRSYRCQNPRLLRFASTLFYDAGVLPSSSAEYFQLPFYDRRSKYPPSTLRFLSTSALPPEKRREHLAVERQKPGIANPTEVKLCLYAFYQAVEKYPLGEISIIAPYRRQVQLIRQELSLERVRKLCPGCGITEKRWQAFLASRVATVDSFQGAESDLVIICYVRSNDRGGIGFVDNPNRINVAHTRCRRELVIVGDLEGLKRQAQNNIFERMCRAFARDGEVIEISESMLEEISEQSLISSYTDLQSKSK